VSYYALLLVVYLGIDTIAAWGLNLEYGVAGVANLGYILLISAGAYTYAVLRLPHNVSLGTASSYIGGEHWPGWVAIIGAIVVGGVLGGALGSVAVRRIRLDYFALVMFGFEILAWTIVGAFPNFLGGQNGLFFIPDPGVSASGWGYAGLIAVVCACSWLVLRRFTGGPVGRTLRAIRDAPASASGLGKNLFGWRIAVQVVGGALAALSGALLVGFLGAWSPAAWTSLETLLFLTAVIVGGMGSDAGALVGVAIVPVLIVQGVQFLPSISAFPELSSDGTMMLFSLVTLGFLFFRTQGIVPERRPKVMLFGTASVSPALAGTLATPQSPALARPTATSRSPALLEKGDPPRRAPSAPAGEVILKAERARVAFGGVLAVRDVDFQARAGEVTGLIGPNGAGKSTLIKVLRGTQRVDSGRVMLEGRDITRLAVFRRARLGVVGTSQLAEPFGRLTVIENLCVAAPKQRAESLLGLVNGRRWWRSQEAEITARAAALLDRFNLGAKANDRAGTLSGGERKMLDVMRALMATPRVLLVDEPMAGVTPALCERIEAALTALADSGVAVVIVEHDLASVGRICDRVVVMALGSVIETGTMDELRTSQVVQRAYLDG
jgi:ABC-type branched-subunit amino acid transport system ATPase component/ABC-type branched-subunit amino acid transport system permease subunit